jgi:FixJ family two-component response regulator
MPDTPALVFVVDDDVSVRESLELLIAHAGWQPVLFSSATAFLAEPLPQAPACLVLDVHLPDLNGLDLQQSMGSLRPELPIIFITGYGDIPLTVRAMRAGAVEFLTKPFNDDELLGILRSTRQHAATAFNQWQRVQHVRQLAAQLTPREREVLPLIVGGLSNKQIANQLGTSEVTAKVHRKHIMAKMQTRSLVNLVELYGLISAAPSPGPSSLS